MTTTAAAIEDDRVIYAKLEAVKEIRTKTIQLEKLKSRLLYEIDSQETEEKSLAEFRQEMDLLLQEKMAHVEELRQIHADINAMEGVIKHSEETRQKAISAALRLHEEYIPLKHDIDRLRRDCLGLERLPEFHEEEGGGITPEKLSKLYNHVKAQSSFYTNKTLDWARSMAQSNSTITSLAPPPPAPMPPTFLSPPPPLPPNPLNLIGTSKSETSTGRSASITSTVTATTLAPSPHPGPPTPTFRQQPPPMKSCLSCHQQIHRNAPICPLCKAKSRSRNPKKPKKKDH